MQYRDPEIQYDSQDGDLEAGFVRGSSDAKQYRRKRSFRATRKRSTKAASPGCGIGARRQRRWTW